ncbi:hypothetical protein ACHHYP_15087 [Achlya hypogyna]|uniref:Uncharacterized protein n=1 Tax=Achlya hypogyna TaxID=1202772 RepID=A0A1V9YBK6_ACHHY|nr:hypothetical protein ACHHYP_15087 [Achlya hypogyna]
MSIEHPGHLPHIKCLHLYDCEDLMLHEILDVITPEIFSTLHYSGVRDRPLCLTANVVEQLSRFTALQRLELAYCCFSIHDDYRVCDRPVSSLRIVTLEAMDADDIDDTPALELRWTNSSLTDSEATAIAYALPRWMARGLEHLDLGGNQIGDDGAMMLAIALTKGRNEYPLKVVLDNNSIGSAGTKALLRALGASRRVTLHLPAASLRGCDNEKLRALASQHGVRLENGNIFLAPAR